ncbi:MAG: ABC transporter permease [Terriglobales bacterium]
MNDLRYAWRGWRRNPGFAAVAIAALALGIGANTAIFSIIDAVLIKPLPYRQPAQLVQLWETESAPGNYPFAGPDFLDWKTQNHTFSDMALYRWAQRSSLGAGSHPDPVVRISAEANFFSLLGASPLLGRTFQPGEDEPGRDRVAILSYALWTRRFAADRGVIGRSVKINAETYTVVGVMPRAFNLPAGAELWTPLDMDAKDLGQRGSHWARAMGRMKPGVTLQQAQAEMTLIAGRLEKRFPQSNYKVGASLVGLHDQLVGDSRASLWMMLLAVALVLVIACANVANLLLARAGARQKEIAVRSALGAGRGRIVRQLLTESILLALGGGALGIGLAALALRSLLALKQMALPQPTPIAINGSVLFFTLAAAVITGLIFGLAPAWQLSRGDANEELKGGAGSTLSPNRRRRRLSDALVVAEIGFTLALVIAAGLLIESFLRLRATDVGVRPQGVLTAYIGLPDARYHDDRASAAFFTQLLDRLRREPGIESAALVSQLPLNGGNNGYVTIAGRPFRPMSGPLVEGTQVTPGYFHVMGIPLLLGRDLTAADIEQATALSRIWKKGFPSPAAQMAATYPVVINQAMAKYFWPGQNPLGQRYTQGEPKGPWAQVVGIVGDVREWSLTQPVLPEAYSPYTGGTWMAVVLHSTLPPLAFAPGLRADVARLDPDLAVFRIESMRQLIADATSSAQLLGLLLGIFASLALLLAAVGIYGVMSYLVAQRTREIGIRISLGATRGSVLSLILRHGGRLALVGVALGVAAALAGGRWLASLLHGIRASDPAIIAGAAAFLFAVALAACYWPACRAARVDPVTALRQE